MTLTVITLNSFKRIWGRYTGFGFHTHKSTFSIGRTLSPKLHLRNLHPESSTCEVNKPIPFSKTKAASFNITDLTKSDREKRRINWAGWLNISILLLVCYCMYYGQDPDCDLFPFITKFVKTDLEPEILFNKRE
ncbi:uncharacterized protein LOC135121409 [Zophobas morio]|uniref:uncharacterized protein LOC135121409 n=1 Tax=Zophobas morio TaxID=2755281 RepID=UPI003083B4DD